MSPLVLHTRVATPEDGAGLAAIYAPIVRDTPISFEDVPPDAAEMGRRVASTLERYPYLVRSDGKTVLGYAYATTFRTRAAYDWSFEMAIYVHAQARRYGVGRSLYATLLALMRHAGYRTAIAGITLPNPESEAFHESFGFRPVARFAHVGFKQGRWHDVGFWQLDLAGEALRPEAPPRPWPQWKDEAEVEDLLAEG
ncbi:MAG: N-acetyltransferase [Planctomycetes bacterium]|nr:N-acetyltransferase [Planctomycetota bacterium]